MTPLNKAILEASEELGIPVDKVRKVYRAYWWSIRDMIQQLELKDDVTEEYLNDNKTSFNISSLGKLYTSYDRIKGVKKRFNYLHNLRNNDSNKETETCV